MTTSEAMPSIAIPCWILEKRARVKGWLSAHELCVLVSLKALQGHPSKNPVSVSYRKITSHACVSKPTAINCIKSLEQKGLIEKELKVSIEGGSEQNNYYLNY